MPRRIKIAFDASPLIVNKTGVAYYTERLMTHIAARHPEADFVGFYYNFLGRRDITHLSTVKNLRYRPVRLIPSKIVYQLRRWGIELPIELLLKERTDFIIYTNFLGYPSLGKTPSAPVIHDLAYIDLPEHVAAKNRSDLQRFVPETIKRAKFVITVSDFSRGKIATAYDVSPENIVVTPIPPAPATRYPAATCKSTLAGLGISKPFLLFLGTVEPRKNLSSLIDGYMALSPELRNTYGLVIAGRIGWGCERELEKIKAAQEQGANVLHIGYVDDQARSVLYQSASAFSSASHYEGFGMPVLEAMSYGLPCIVSDIPVFREVADTAAAYFDPGDPQSVAAALQKCLSSKSILQEMSHQSTLRAQLFSWDEVADSLYGRIVSQLPAA